MALYQAKAFPIEYGGNGWKSISSVKKSFPKLEENIKADWLIIGAGFTGIAAAQRLTELRGNDKIVLIDALEIAEGPVGRNSGFMIDVPHNIETSGSYTKEIEKDRQDIFRNRKIIKFVKNMSEQYSLQKNCFNNIGKINGATNEKSHQLNLKFKKHLDAMSEKNELLDQNQMYDLTGSSYYKSGLFTPGTILLQPAEFAQRIISALHQKISVFENSPVISLEKIGNCWKIKTPKGEIDVPKIIMATNGQIQNFNFFQNKFIHLITFCSMTKEIDNSYIKGDFNWGITPSDPIGTTFRRYEYNGKSRFIIRNTWRCRQDMIINKRGQKDFTKRHHNDLVRRIPTLSNIDFEYQWGGRVCLSYNGAPAFGELDDGLFSACCSNGLGTIKGTMAGKTIIDYICKANDSDISYFTEAKKPSILPPNFLIEMGANCKIKFQEFLAGTEL